jgi:phage protein D
VSSPIFQVLFNGGDITGVVEQRLLSLSVQDHAGNEADSFILRLADDEPRIPAPLPGAEVVVSMGYLETGLVQLGTFIVNEIEFSVDPAWEMRVHGESVDMLSEIRTTRFQAWSEVTLGTIISAIAARNDLTPAIDPALAGRFYEHIDQMNKSDMHFATHLAYENGAVFKVVEGVAVFARRGADDSVSGRQITDVTITPEDNVLGLRALFHRRGHHKQIIGVHYDYDRATSIPNAVPGPGDEPDRTLSRRYPNMEEATWAASSEANRLRAVSGRLTLELIGRPELAAEGFVTLAGFRDPVNGPWKIRQVEHELTQSGFRTVIEGELPTDARTADSGGGTPSVPTEGGQGPQQ